MVLKQFIFLRKDLPKFGKGALVAQACHASVAALHVTRDIPETEEYLADLQNMHKVILKIEKDDIRDIVMVLNSSEIKYYEWIEQPEGICTVVATQPFDLDMFPDLKEYFFKYKLY